MVGKREVPLSRTITKSESKNITVYMSVSPDDFKSLKLILFKAKVCGMTGLPILQTNSQGIRMP